MTIQETILKIKQRLNKLDTNDYDNVPLWDIIEAINKATLSLISRKYGYNNATKTGFESTRKRVDDLQILVNDEPYDLSILKKSNYYTANIPDNYLHFVRIDVEATKGKCIKNIRSYQVEESNIHTYMANYHMKPSFLWGETLVTIANDKIKIYTDDEFDIKSAKLVYMRLPIKVDIEGYTHLNGQNSTNIHPEFNDDVMEEIIDEATRILKGDIQDGLGLQISQQNLNMGE